MIANTGKWLMMSYYHMSVSKSNRLHTHTYTHAYTHLHTPPHTHMHTHTCTHTHTHTHMHTLPLAMVENCNIQRIALCMQYKRNISSRMLSNSEADYFRITQQYFHTILGSLKGYTFISRENIVENTVHQNMHDIYTLKYIFLGHE